MGGAWITIIFTAADKISHAHRGAQCLSGRMLDSRLKGCRFELHGRHCVASLSRALCPLLSTGLTQEDPF